MGILDFPQLDLLANVSSGAPPAGQASTRVWGEGGGVEGFWQISSGSTPNQIYNPVDQDRRHNYLYFLSNRKLLERLS